MTLSIKRLADDQAMTAVLVEEDTCIFSGFMVGCKGSTVVVTGCDGEHSVQIQSDMFGDLFFTIKKGDVMGVELIDNLQRGRRDTVGEYKPSCI